MELTILDKKEIDIDKVFYAIEEREYNKENDQVSINLIAYIYPITFNKGGNTSFLITKSVPNIGNNEIHIKLSFNYKEYLKQIPKLVLKNLAKKLNIDVESVQRNADMLKEEFFDALMKIFDENNIKYSYFFEEASPITGETEAKIKDWKRPLWNKFLDEYLEANYEIDEKLKKIFKAHLVQFELPKSKKEVALIYNLHRIQSWLQMQERVNQQLQEE